MSLKAIRDEALPYYLQKQHVTCDVEDVMAGLVVQDATGRFNQDMFKLLETCCTVESGPVYSRIANASSQAQIWKDSLNNGVDLYEHVYLLPLNFIKAYIRHGWLQRFWPNISARYEKDKDVKTATNRIMSAFYQQMILDAIGDVNDNVLVAYEIHGYERRLLQDYKISRNKFDTLINKPTRDDLSRLPEYERSFHELETAIIDAMNVMLPLQEDLYVWRGLRVANIEKVHVHDKGFISTSLLKEGAAQFGQIIMRIKVPAGARYFPLVAFQHSSSNEYEILLPPGSLVNKGKVIDMAGSRVSRGRLIDTAYYYEMDYIPRVSRKRKLSIDWSPEKVKYAKYPGKTEDSFKWNYGV